MLGLRGMKEGVEGIGIPQGTFSFVSSSKDFSGGIDNY
jgi:hypothetical protein